MSASHSPPLHSLRARYVFPVAGKPIRNGVVTLAGARIAAVGTKPLGTLRDLGPVALLPGLVNAHTHLEFSDLERPLGSPGMGLVDWLQAVLRFRRENAGPAPRPAAIRQGLVESLRGGTTTLGEIAQPDWGPPALAAASGDVTAFLELIAPTLPRVAQAQQLALAFLRSGGPWRQGLCLHAPYTVHPQLFARLLGNPALPPVPVACHLAESREERELLLCGGGPFADWLRGWEGWKAEDFSPGKRPLDYLSWLAAAPRALVIHGNYLDDEEIAFLSRHAATMSVVYCPRTHAYFRHDTYPLERMLQAGVALALGTDSRASSPDLSLLAEMRQVRARHPGLAPATVLGLGTWAGARALGREAEVGTLQPGKYADLVAVALPEHDAPDPHELLLDSPLPVVATWVQGKLIIL